jgi:hypothetical protein
MSRRGTARRSLGSTGSTTPDAYHVEHIKINSWDLGEEKDITDSVKKIKVTEDLNQPYVEVHLVILDAIGLINELKMNGSEIVKLKIKRNPEKKSSQDNAKLELTLKAIEIFGYSRLTPTRQGYTIRCCSEHLYKNQTKLLQRPFENTIGKLVEDIVRKDLGVDQDRINVLNTSTKGIIKGIYPSLRPYYAIKWLLRNAYEDSTPFYFYETARGGIYFQSYKSLVQQEPYDTYDYRSFFEADKGTPEYYDEVRRRITRLSSPLNMSQFNNIGQGVYGSTLHTFDIAEKKKEKYFYSYGKMKTLNENKPYPANDQISDQAYEDLKQSKNYYISLNTKAFEGQNNYHEPLKPTILKGEAHYQSMNFNDMKVDIPGDFFLEAGFVMDLNVIRASSAAQLEESNMIDKFFSGKYLIQRIEHVFDGQYRQNITLRRDSLGVTL